MSDERNIIKWHYLTDYNTGKVTGLRGWDSRLQERYEMEPTEDPVIWTCCVVNVSTPGDWWPSQIHKGGVLSCMVEAENVADQRYAKQAESDTD